LPKIIKISSCLLKLRLAKVGAFFESQCTSDVCLCPSVRPYVRPSHAGVEWRQMVTCLSPSESPGTMCNAHRSKIISHYTARIFLFIALITLRRPISYAHRFCFNFIFCFDVSFCDAALRIALSVRLSVPYMPTAIGQ